MASSFTVLLPGLKLVGVPYLTVFLVCCEWPGRIKDTATARDTSEAAGHEILRGRSPSSRLPADVIPNEMHSRAYLKTVEGSRARRIRVTNDSRPTLVSKNRE